MKRRLALVAVAVVALASIITTATAAPESNTNNTKQSSPPPPSCTFLTFKPFAEQVWRLDKWRRGEPKKAVTAAAKRRMACAGESNRLAMQQAWQRAKIVYFDFRKDKLAERRRHLRYLDATDPPGLATLEAIAACESGGDPTAVDPSGTYRGKYQFDYETWASIGGSGDPAAAPEREQDERAAALYRQRGSSPWPVCGV